MHIQRHTHAHKHACTISTQEKWQQPGTGAWLRGAKERLFLEMSEKIRYSRIQRKGFEHLEVPAKLLGYFLRSNKSNINQSRNRLNN